MLLRVYCNFTKYILTLDGDSGNYYIYFTSIVILLNNTMIVLLHYIRAVKIK